MHGHDIRIEECLPKDDWLCNATHFTFSVFISNNMKPVSFWSNEENVIWGILKYCSRFFAGAERRLREVRNLVRCHL
jgi:hypothetical protein